MDFQYTAGKMATKIKRILDLHNLLFKYSFSYVINFSAAVIQTFPT